VLPKKSNAFFEFSAFLELFDFFDLAAIISHVLGGAEVLIDR
jgi:hypothetical protein